MKTIPHVFTAFCFLLISLTVKANNPPKNTLVIKTINYSSNLHWLNTGKEVLIIAAPVNITEENILPKKGINYAASQKFGEGTAILNGFVIYKGKENSISVSDLKVGQMYCFSSFEADANGNFTIPGPPLTSFVCMSLGHNAHLVWNSSNEITNDKITVERTTDLKNWMQIENAGTLPLTVDLPGINFYDKGPLDGNYAYRIKHIYSNNEIVVSQPINVFSFTMDAVFSVSPPDAHENNYFIVADETTDLTITNAKGELVKKIMLEEKTGYSYSFKDVPPGIYNIHGQNNNGVLNQKVTID